MPTSLTITSRSQGQIFGPKPTVQDFERQLEADPTYKFYNKIQTILVALSSNLQFLKRTGWKPFFALQSKTRSVV